MKSLTLHSMIACVTLVACFFCSCHRNLPTPNSCELPCLQQYLKHPETAGGYDLIYLAEVTKIAGRFLTVKVKTVVLDYDHERSGRNRRSTLEGAIVTLDCGKTVNAVEIGDHRYFLIEKGGTPLFGGLLAGPLDEQCGAIKPECFQAAEQLFDNYRQRFKLPSVKQ